MVMAAFVGNNFYYYCNYNIESNPNLVQCQGGGDNNNSNDDRNTIE